MLHILSEKKRRAFYLQNIGSTQTVLFENDIEDGFMHGFTENYVRVSAKYDPVMIKELLTVRLVAIDQRGNVLAEEVNEVPETHVSSSISLKQSQ
jgi:threonylcarbamoyladenosine tRNA methylthiotransferase MtaB